MLPTDWADRRRCLEMVPEQVSSPSSADAVSTENAAAATVMPAETAVPPTTDCSGAPTGDTHVDLEAEVECDTSRA